MPVRMLLVFLTTLLTPRLLKSIQLISMSSWLGCGLPLWTSSSCSLPMQLLHTNAHKKHDPRAWSICWHIRSARSHWQLPGLQNHTWLLLVRHGLLIFHDFNDAWHQGCQQVLHTPLGGPSAPTNKSYEHPSIERESCKWWLHRQWLCDENSVHQFDWYDFRMLPQGHCIGWIAGTNHVYIL